MLDRTIATRIRRTAKSVFLLGPRQVGKSTLIKELHPDRIINLADEALFISYSKDPEQLKRELLAISQPSLIALDEIQRVPSLLNTVQTLMDGGCKHRFILTGSSARKLRERGVNLLPGRVLLEYLDPLSIWEMGPVFDLEKVLRQGSLPGIYVDDQEGPEILSSYTTIYLREEIQVESAARNIGSYARFLDLAAAASGQWINYSKIASDSEIPKETIRRFFTILEDTLIAFRIPPFHERNSQRRVSQRDRFVFFDIGVRNAVLGLHQQMLSPDEKGHLFEQWILLQCLAFLRAHKKPWKLSSYRTDQGQEVDVVLDTGKKLLAIECKYGKNVSSADMRGLRSFEKITKRSIQKYLVFRGETPQSFPEGEIAIPFGKFLLEVLPGLG